MERDRSEDPPPLHGCEMTAFILGVKASEFDISEQLADERLAVTA